MDHRSLWCLLISTALVFAVPLAPAAQQSPNVDPSPVAAALAQPAGAAPSAAGGPEGSLLVLGLLSYQPPNNYYVGSPYLDAGLAGLGPGISAGFQAAGRSGLVGSFEFSTGRLQSTLSGRFVGSAPVEVSVTDTLLSVLVGYRYRAGRGDVRVLGGPGLSLRLKNFPANFGLNGADDSASVFAVSGGIDVAQAVHPRLSIVETFRYSYISRSDHEKQLGLGNHILRFGFGIRFRLSEN